ncbi:MAG: methylenetetrahydrofolate reductase C-terminal domain-containing protein [Sulfolobales archaeon]|nr:methylenetetrahydrofolate reductase C-terminal domain-containing protein [Sulfolobales archaeon]MCX8185578.1 methylenetetrahydrofolate reductase C-terminal domain-containing protein [Sulfolobales archaeon]MDW7969521.1 methylenetetrahydrofolate reductase C-terminal domain-containing protein [Sulfolobales archaeon]
MAGCPKNMLNGPCGGYRDSRCEVLGECVWVKLYNTLGQHDKRYEVFTKVNLRPYFKLRDYYSPARRDLSKFMNALSKGNAIAYEVFTQPNSLDIPKLLDMLAKLSTYLDAYAIVDSPMGLRTYDQLALALMIKNHIKDSDVLMNIASRNKHVEELISYLVTSLNCDIRNYIFITGDWPRNKVGAFFELDSTQSVYLCRLISDLCVDYGGKKVNVGSKPAHIGVAVNQYSSYLELEILRCVRKLRAGAEFVVTQPIYSISRFNQLARSLRAYDPNVKLVTTYAVVDSAGRLNSLNNLGINLDNSEKERIINLLRTNDLVTANELMFREVLEEVKGLSNGFYISTYGNNEVALTFLKRVRKELKNM